MSNWNIKYTTVFGKTMVESFNNKSAAQSRYNELVARTYGSLGDIMSLSCPRESAVAVREEKEYNWDDFKDVVSRALPGLEENPRNASFRVECHVNCKTVRSADGSPLLNICDGYNPKTMDWDSVVIQNLYMDSKDFNKAFDYCRDAVDQMALALEIPDIPVKKEDKFAEDCGSSAASLGAVPTGATNKKSQVVKESLASLNAAYGDGDVIDSESSADGFYATVHNPLAWAILHNDTVTLERLHDGTAVVPEEPYNCTGWYEDIDAPEDSNGNYPYIYSMENDYEQTFVKDFCRVVGTINNNDALRMLLEYIPDATLPPLDFYNAFHHGVDKDVLEKFFYNIRTLVDNDSDLNGNYFAYDEFGDNPIDNLAEFFKEN